MEKSPAFQFYPKDWRDKRVARMDYFTRGVYLEILCFMWLDSKDQCSIENDEKLLMKMLQLREDQFRRCWEQIQWAGDPIFAEKKGRLISRRLQKTKRQQDEHRRLKSEAGAKGAKKRWQSHTSAIRLPLANDASSSPTPTPTSSSSSKGEGEGDHPPASGGVKEHLAAAYRSCVRVPLSREKAIRHVEAALEVGVHASVIEAAFMDPGNQGKKIWEILDPLRKVNGPSEQDRVKAILRKWGAL